MGDRSETKESIGMKLMSDVVRGINTRALFVYDVRSEDGQMAPNKIALNYLVQFIDMLTIYDEKTLSKHAIKID